MSFRKNLHNAALAIQGKSIEPLFEMYKNYEYSTIEKNNEIQQQNLKKLLLHAYAHIPYYQKIFDNIGLISEQGVIDLSKFDRIPVLTKKIIRENFDDLISRDSRSEHNRRYIDTSGGSTGEPVKMLKDLGSWRGGMAVKWLFYSFVCDYPCRTIKLWGSERDILKDGAGLISRTKDFVGNRDVVNAFKMSEDDMRDFVALVNRKKPKIIEAYVQPLYEVCRFVKGNDIEIFSPEGIITSAGTLYPEMHRLISDVFDAPVLNRYGSREVGDLACSCSKNEGLHVNTPSHVLEILDADLQHAAPGKLGKVYVTSLLNYSMPLIRYEIGDIAIPAEEEQCSCGRGLPLIKQLEGREMSVLKTKDGTIIPGEFFIHFIGVVFNKGFISRFQLIQKKYDEILIKVVVKDMSEFEKGKINIENSIKKTMGDDCLIVWEFVDDIEPLASGKYVYIVSEVD